MKFNTKTIHGGQIKEKGYGAVMPPIYQTSTYSQTKPGEHKGYEYVELIIQRGLHSKIH